MNLSEGFRLAYQTVKANKLRTFLTTLGIVIGVMAVIGMMSIINALDRYMNEALSAIGGNTFFVQKHPAVQMGRLDAKYRNRKNITLDHAKAIERNATAVGMVSPESYTFGKEIKSADLSTNPNVLVHGGDRYWLEGNGQFVNEGRFINEEDVDHRRMVIVLGADVVEKIFPYSYAVEEEVRIDGIKFRVIGVLDRKGEILGGSQDNMVIIPISTFSKIFGQKRSIGITVKAKSSDLFNEAMDQTIAILRVARKVPPGKENDFEVITQDSIMDTLKNLTGFVFIAAVVICSISLLVGGIGIMNIMLVSVTERTREIGVRKAIGAKRRDILSQFLIEAMGICMFGGIIGIIIGAIIGVIISGVLKLPPTIPVWSIFLGAGFSLMIGLIFGVYPALKAARLNPIEALRYE